MPIIRKETLERGEPRPGWHNRFFQSENMSFAYYDVDPGADMHEHLHTDEEVWYIIEGELAITIDGRTGLAGPGDVAIVPPDTPHSVRALTHARVIVTNYPGRERVRHH